MSEIIFVGKLLLIYSVLAGAGIGALLLALIHLPEVVCEDEN